MEEAVKQRIKQILTYYKMTQNAFAGDDRPFQKRLSRQLNGVAALDFVTLATILIRFPDISAEWLLRGEGEMLKTGGARIINNSNTINKTTNNGTNINTGSGDINYADKVLVQRLLEQNSILIEIIKNKM